MPREARRWALLELSQSAVNPGRMFKRIALPLAAAAVVILSGSPAAAGEPLPRIDIGKMMGRWYEVARAPNSIQKGCQAGASEWTPRGDGFAVLQTCRKGSP